MISAEHTDIAVLSLGGVVYAKAVRTAGAAMDTAVADYVKRKYNLLIGDRTAEDVKIELGSAFPLAESIMMEVRGRNLVEGIPKTIVITDEEVREALEPCIVAIVNAVRVALERLRLKFPLTSSIAASCSPVVARC